MPTNRELVENSVVKESLTTAADGKSYSTKLYSFGRNHLGWLHFANGRVVKLNRETGRLYLAVTEGIRRDQFRRRHGRAHEAYAGGNGKACGQCLTPSASHAVVSATTQGSRLTTTMASDSALAKLESSES
jgi:DNA-binding IclR family transcriptional regulator